MRLATKRLAKELTELRASGAPAGCALLQADDLQTWLFSISVLGESVYAGETFALRFRFPDAYPMESPECVFVTDGGWKAPVHGHVYSNGHICASILGNEWSPVLHASSVLLTIQSMLASAKKKELPPDNDRYVKRAPLSPKDTRWAYHDDNV
ncbi:UBC-like protein [Tilletiopsis washingtonensis]|uniref:UBC-like protein n=1 Tax=Tilletiopsis washingtonensis TaxID=58919 RepID=A0A316ZGH4_9BASI|nr:UBC-like protein [Tilletiopsis washingtonensis]PWO00149.1 UBC-like protein [Tilletiopsis washingtonensis]